MSTEAAPAPKVAATEAAPAVDAAPAAAPVAAEAVAATTEEAAVAPVVEEKMAFVEPLCLKAFPEGDLTLEQKTEILLSIGEECIKAEDLIRMIEKKPVIRAYDGFEPSGRMHIAQGIMKAINVNKMTRCGVEVVFWVADWFAMLNEKMGGDMKKIRKVGMYFIEVWKAAGMDMDKVTFIWSSEAINERPGEYWTLVMDIARKFNLKRIMRCGQIMGRGESAELSSAQIMYPCMQCADIFFLKADICQLGMDQRKVNMLAREYCTAIKRKNKPVILSHHMIMGLKKGQEKMSKSDPDSAIFMEDSAADVKRKIKKAFCPMAEVEGNPCVDYIRYIVFPAEGHFFIPRPESDGGDIDYSVYSEFEADFVAGKIFPNVLKPALTTVINRLIAPVRDHFVNDKDAKNLLKTIRKYKVTK